MAVAHLTKGQIAQYGPKRVQYVRDRGLADGPVLPIGSNGPLIGFLHLGRRGRVDDEFVPLDDLEISLVVHKILILLATSRVRSDKTVVRTIMEALRDYFSLTEAEIQEIEQWTAELAVDHERDWNQYNVKVYTLLSKATLLDKRQRRNPGKKLAELVPVLTHSDARGSELCDIEDTNVSRQGWVIELGTRDDRIKGLILGREVQTSDELEAVLELGLQLLWPRLLAVTSAANLFHSGEISDPAEVYRYLVEGLDIEDHYSWLMEPVRPFTDKPYAGLARLSDADLEFYTAQLWRRRHWLAGRERKGPYNQLLSELAGYAQALAEAVQERRMAAARKAARRFKSRLRKREPIWYPPADPGVPIPPISNQSLLESVPHE